MPSNQIDIFSQNLVFLRKKQKKTQAEQADALNLKRSTYAGYEKKESFPDFKTLFELADQLNVSVGDLVGVDLEKEVSNEVMTAVAEKAPAYGQMGIPLIPIDAAAGLAKGEQTVLMVDAQRYVVPEFANKADYMIRITGTSMNPKYFNGDIVACKIVPNNSFIQWGKVYVLDTVQGPLCKRLMPGKTDGFVKVVSDNSKHYPAFEMKFSEIRSMAVVVGTIRLE